MDRDSIDVLVDEWKIERPDLNPSSMGVVGRILVLASHLGRSASDVLGKQGLSFWAFDVLSTLKRKGRPYRLSPSQLSRAVILSPAAMVNRIDRLESAGMVRRLPNPADRRALIVELTPKGQEAVDFAIVLRFTEADRAVSALSKPERRTLAELLRKLLVQYERA
jgi:DNA-binding MarR family transcriptional regulator